MFYATKFYDNLQCSNIYHKMLYARSRLIQGAQIIIIASAISLGVPGQIASFPLPAVRRGNGRGCGLKIKLQDSYLFIFIIIVYLFLAVLDLLCHIQAFYSYRRQGYSLGVVHGFLNRSCGSRG